MTEQENTPEGAGRLPPTSVTGVAPRLCSHVPPYHRTEGRVAPEPAACEALLREWFGAEVILLASGRTGLHLALEALGYHRYRSKLWVPPYLSRCVISAVTPTVFPVESASHADGRLLYHQYGFPQRDVPCALPTVEDIAHAFFATAESGLRPWRGDAVVFSLPKFLPLAGMAGGVVVPDSRMADAIRARVEQAPAAPEGVRVWMHQVLADSNQPGGIDCLLVDSAYELLLKLVRPDPGDLVGFPESLDAIARVGEARQERVTLFRQRLGARAFPAGFWPATETILPFALPYFGNGELGPLERVDAALREAGVVAKIYHVDVKRDMAAPDYRPCVLVPCHQGISLTAFEEICRIIECQDAPEASTSL